jgi:hypothetical protein
MQKSLAARFAGDFSCNIKRCTGSVRQAKTAKKTSLLCLDSLLSRAMRPH